MNLRDIIKSTCAYNFHAHTQFCDGRNTIEEIAEAAYRLGYKHFGFSPHSPIDIESPCNMKATDFQAYREEIERIRQKYAGEMAVYLGMEIDYLGTESDSGMSEITSQLDYSIGSVHFIPDQEGVLVDIDGRFEHFKERMTQHFHNDIEYVARTFYAQSHKMLEKGGFDIIGHFDKISQNASYFQPGIEEKAWYGRMADEYIDHIVESPYIVEINTKARRQHGRFFPHEKYWRRLLDADVPLMVNSDAHFAELVAESRDEAFKILESLKVPAI